MVSPATKRMRHLRQRRANGRAVLRVEVDEVAHVERLIARGLLRPNQCDDRVAIASATERLLDSLEVADVHSS
jgi:hypothetical protein